jgi:hypothetical protein
MGKSGRFLPHATNFSAYRNNEPHNLPTCGIHLCEFERPGTPHQSSHPVEQNLPLE